MDRLKLLLRDIDKSMLGLEVAPWFTPIAPKSDGYNVHTLDVFDHETLLERAGKNSRIDPSRYGNIEPLDYVGSATELLSLVPAELHGRFDYVISSHNFEHLPNPIKFLQGCEALLRDGGRVIMAVPDGRACYDYFRPHTITADWLEAYVEDRKRPAERHLFAALADRAYVREQRDNPAVALTFNTPRTEIENHATLTQKWSEWTQRSTGGPYLDAHCSVMTPASLQLLLEDCMALGLFAFDIREVMETRGVEFIIHLVKGTGERGRDADAFQARRTQLLHKIWDEQAVRFGARRHLTAAIAEGIMNPAPNLGLFRRFKLAVRRRNQLRLARRRAR